MARIRTIKPTFFRSRSVKRLSQNAKLVWIGLWNLADDEGRLLDELGILAGDLWSLSLSESKLNAALEELHNEQRIVRYEVAGQMYIQVTNWSEHQRINRPAESLLPPVPLTDVSVKAPAPLTSGREGKGNGREGSAEAPSPYCKKHPEGTDKPCGACGTARLLFEQHVKAQKPVLASVPDIRRPPTPDECESHKIIGGFCVHCGYKEEVA
jgi:hypothetical protein